MRQWKRLEHRWETRERTETNKRSDPIAPPKPYPDAAEQARDVRAWDDLFARRLNSDADYAAFEEGARQIWRKYPYSGEETEVWLRLRRIRDGRPVDIEPLIEYLERDPWEFRSGYRKGEIIRALRRRDLTEGERDRLANVVLKVAAGRDRREFRDYCRLARKVDSLDLRDALRRLIEVTVDPDTRRRADWMLRALHDKDAGR